MSFRLYTGLLSQASRRFATGLLVFGLGLIVFGFLVYILRQIFAILAAAVFILVGAGCIVTAAKICWAQKKLNQTTRDAEPYRQNVRIRVEEHYDI